MADQETKVNKIKHKINKKSIKQYDENHSFWHPF